MADLNQSVQSNSAYNASFPPPPWVYIQNYSDEFFLSNRSPKPPPPPDSQAIVFGSVDPPSCQSWDLTDVRKLYPQNYSVRAELHKLNRSILASFLDLLDVIVRSPESQFRENKLEDLKTLFVNAQYLINDLRPTQARETLRVMADRQVISRRNVLEKLEKVIEMNLSTLSEQLQQINEQIEAVENDPTMKLTSQIVTALAEAVASASTEDN